MKLLENPDACINFLSLLKHMTEQQAQNIFITGIRDNIQEIFSKNKDDFYDIHQNKDIMDKILKIYSIEIDDLYECPKEEDIEILTNKNFCYAYFKRKKSYNIILFEKMAILSRGPSNVSLFHLNPRILNEFDFIYGSTPHQKMDVKIKLNQFFQDPYYKTINKLIYSALLIKKAPYDFNHRDIYKLSQNMLKTLYTTALLENFKEKENEIYHEAKVLRSEIKKLQNIIAYHEGFKIACQKSYKILNEIL